MGQVVVCERLGNVEKNTVTGVILPEIVCHSLANFSASLIDILRFHLQLTQTSDVYAHERSFPSLDYSHGIPGDVRSRR